MSATRQDKNKYLSAIAEGTGPIARGQFDVSYEGWPSHNSWINTATSSGTPPRIFMWDYDWSWISRRVPMMDRTYDYVRDSGAIVALGWHQCSMDTAAGVDCQWDPGVSGQGLTTQQWSDLLDPSTAYHGVWRDKLDLVAADLLELKDNDIIVLFRPYHEPNISTFWWGFYDDAAATSNYIALWRMYYDILTTELGLTNLIWVQSFSHHPTYQDFAKWYPGDAYVDMLGIDAYPPLADTQPYYDTAWTQLKLCSATKPLAISECSMIPTDTELSTRDWRYVLAYGEADMLRDNTQQRIDEFYGVEQPLLGELTTVIGPRIQSSTPTTAVVITVPVSPAAGDITVSTGAYAVGATPTVAEIEAGTDAISYSQDAVPSWGHARPELTGLPADYDIFVVSRDSADSVLKQKAGNDMSIVVQASGQSVHVGADWDGTDYTNESETSKGILLEPADFNRCLYSDDITQWLGTGGVVANAAASIIAGEMADQLTIGPDFGTAKYFIANDLDIEVPVSPSFWMKKLNDFNIDIYNATSDANGEWSLDVAALTTDWEYISADHPAVTVVTPFVSIANARAGLNFARVVNLEEPSFLIAAADIKNGTFPSSYVPTSGTAVERAATRLSQAIVGKTNNVSGTIIVRPQFNPAQSRGGDTVIMQLYADATNHISLIWATATDVIALVKTVAGTPHTATYADGDLAYVRDKRLVIDWSVGSGGMSLQVEGFAAKTDTDTSPLQASSIELVLGSAYDGSGGAYQIVESNLFGGA